MAVLRASVARIPIVLVSATPSLETVVNIGRGRYERVHLPRRHAEAALPRIELLDMRRERLPSRPLPGGPAGRGGRRGPSTAGEQVLFFLNRRGYAPLTLCRACGHRMQCPSCTAWLVEHRFTGRLQCHHCGHAETVPALCPECLATGSAGAVRTRGRADQGGGRGAVPGGPDRADGQRSAAGPRAAAELVEAMTDASLRRADRHPDRRQGPPFSDADPGRGGRCRSRHDRRRSARRRADLSAAASGRRPRRARRAAGPGADPDLYAGAAGHAARSPPATATGFSPPRRRRGAPPGCRRSAGWRR